MKKENERRVILIIRIQRVHGIEVKSDSYGLIEVGNGNIIRRFNTKKEDIICPSFINFAWANGCPSKPLCSYCYLHSTFFRQGIRDPISKKIIAVPPRVKDRDKIFKHLRALFDSDVKPALLNAGELCDSMVDPVTLREIMEFFEYRKTHRLLTLTKFTNQEVYLKSARTRGGGLDIPDVFTDQSYHYTIPSFSLNAREVAERWERNAPPIDQRLYTISYISARGYNGRIRIRIDPIIPIDGWKDKYIDLIDNLFKVTRPERITLGTLRGRRQIIANCPDTSWVEYLTDSSGWGMRLPFELRIEIYQHLIDYLRDEYSFKNIGLCKETVKVHDVINVNVNSCNCIW